MEIKNDNISYRINIIIMFIYSMRGEGGGGDGGDGGDVPSK